MEGYINDLESGQFPTITGDKTDRLLARISPLLCLRFLNSANRHVDTRRLTHQSIREKNISTKKIGIGMLIS